MDDLSAPAILVDLPSLAATETLAGRVGAMLRREDAILLSGPLGAGKSAFARALLRSLTGDPALDVPSPSFTIVQSYETPRGMVHHYDLWRLEPGPDLGELGLDEALRDITVIEWPDRLGDEAPIDALAIDLIPVSENARRARLRGWPGRLNSLAVA
jgi:tRNA threonylcarbamoyladenosine biosynthesis protein TsaE